MVYCYAKLSKWDCFYFRLGGPGLGNLLFPWARAKVLARQYGYQFVAPAWPQLKLGPLLRGEVDSRNYFSLFRALPKELTGLRRLWVMVFCKRVPEQLWTQALPGDVVEISGIRGLFDGLLDDPDFLREELLDMLAVNRIPQLARACECATAVAVHVRYGDFLSFDNEVNKGGGFNRKQPIDWYVAAVEAIRRHLGENTQVNVFSDAKDSELSALLALPRMRRVHGNNAIEDMLLISRHKVLIASGSTFSMWATFLGQIPTIWFPGQMRFSLVKKHGCEIEYEPGDDMSQFFSTMADTI
jgi:hypothetical protein